jgi:hypothetical protein
MIVSNRHRGETSIYLSRKWQCRGRTLTVGDGTDTVNLSLVESRVSRLSEKKRNDIGTRPPIIARFGDPGYIAAVGPGLVISVLPDFAIAEGPSCESLSSFQDLCRLQATIIRFRWDSPT